MDKDPLAEAWGRAIRSQREMRGISQAELATRLEVTQASVSRWEQGRSAPPYRLLPAIADALDVAPSVLFQFPPAVA